MNAIVLKKVQACNLCIVKAQKQAVISMVKPHPCIFVVELNAYITIMNNNNNIYLSHKNFNKLCACTKPCIQRNIKQEKKNY